MWCKEEKQTKRSSVLSQWIFASFIVHSATSREHFLNNNCTYVCTSKPLHDKACYPFYNYTAVIDSVLTHTCPPFVQANECVPCYIVKTVFTNTIIKWLRVDRPRFGLLFRTNRAQSGARPVFVMGVRSPKLERSIFI